MNAAHLLRLIDERPATLGGTRVMCIDGPSGSGKSTLARDVLDLSPEASLVVMDDLYEGWRGLEAGTAILADIVRALESGHDAVYQRYDWSTMQRAESVVVPPAPLLIVEGVGAGSLPAELITLLVWVEAAPEQRLRRALDRDGEAARNHLRQWAADETAHFTRLGTRERAQILIDTSG